MKARLIEKDDVLKIVDLLREKYDVIAPFSITGRDTYFETVTDSNRNDIRLHLPNPFYPPKRYVFPHIERLMRVKTNNDNIDILVESNVKPLAIFGIRSCDLAGIGHLDRFYLGNAYRDCYYEARRKNLFLVNMVCTEVGVDITEDCFCLCADTGPAAKELFDLQLMDLGDVYLAVAGTQSGEEFLSNPMFKRATEKDIELRRQILSEVRKSFKDTTSWFSATVRYISRGSVLEDTWEEIGRRCLECGGCTYVCPACTCFTVSDRKIGDGEVERVRIWDSCALGGFTRMAGGFNPRKAVHDRRNRRFYRKLAHYFIQRELSMACVGCGRCATVCHGDVGMPSVVEMIRRATAILDEK